MDSRMTDDEAAAVAARLFGVEKGREAETKTPCCPTCGQEVSKQKWLVKSTQVRYYEVTADSKEEAEEAYKIYCNGGTHKTVFHMDTKEEVETNRLWPYEPVRYALMMRGNNGANPEYEYWTRKMSGRALSNGAGCFRNFNAAIQHLKKYSRKEGRGNVFLVGIFDSIDEPKYEKRLGNLEGIHIDDVCVHYEAIFKDAIPPAKTND